MASKIKKTKEFQEDVFYKGILSQITEDDDLNDFIFEKISDGWSSTNLDALWDLIAIVRKDFIELEEEFDSEDEKEEYLEDEEY